MQEEMKQIGEYQLIKSKRIIGMTSTGAARCNSLIHLLQTPIGKEMVKILIEIDHFYGTYCKMLNL